MCYYHNLFYCLSDTDNLLFYKNSQILRLNTEAIYLLSACIVDSSLITYSAFVARARLERYGSDALVFLHTLNGPAVAKLQTNECVLF